MHLFEFLSNNVFQITVFPADKDSQNKKSIKWSELKKVNFRSQDKTLRHLKEIK